MATQVNANNLVKFYTGTALPETPVANHIYFIIGEEAYGAEGAKKPVGQIYKGSQLVAEINDNLKIAEIESAINALDEKLSKEIDDHIELYEALVQLVEGHGTRLTTAEGKLTTLIGEDANKSVRTIANEELVKQLIPENAAEALDTLQEIAAWIQAHPGDAAAMNKAIEDLEALVGSLPEGITATNVTGYIAEVKTALEQSISAEKARAEAAEKELDDAIAAEAERAAAAEKVNADAIAAEKVRAEAAEKANADNIALLDERMDSFDKILDEEGSVTQAIAQMAVELKQYADQAEADAIAKSKEYKDTTEIVKFPVPTTKGTKDFMYYSLFPIMEQLFLIRFFETLMLNGLNPDEYNTTNTEMLKTYQDANIILAEKKYSEFKEIYKHEIDDLYELSKGLR